MTQTAIQPQAQSTVLTTVKKWLDQQKDGFANMLPKHMTTDRFFKIALNCISKTPALQKCTPASLFQSITTAAELGLEPGGALGEAYLVPYGNVCQLQIGYRGLIRLARQSGELATIEAHVVHENDDYELQYGLDPKCSHTPTLTRDPGKPVFVYVVAKLKGGGHHIEAMTVAEIEKIRLRSKSGNSGPWMSDWSEMAKKTVVRRAAKYLPLSSEKWQTANEVDDSDYVDGEVVADMKAETDAATPSKGNDKARKALAEKKASMKIIDALPEETATDALEREKAAGEVVTVDASAAAPI